MNNPPQVKRALCAFADPPHDETGKTQTEKRQGRRLGDNLTR